MGAPRALFRYKYASNASYFEFNISLNSFPTVSIAYDPFDHRASTHWTLGAISIMLPSTQALLLSVALAGPLSHLLYFQHGEHHLKSLKILQSLVFFPILGTLVLSMYVSEGYWTALKLALASEAFYILSLWTSMIIYRRFFHCLRSFPGPIGWSISKLPQAYENISARGYAVIDKLHQQYGDYVRTGPNELSIIDPDACSVLYNTHSQCDRAPWYDMSKPLQSMLETRNRQDHDKRRRACDRGFSVKALKNYESRVTRYTMDLLDQLAAFGGRSVDVSKWLNYYSFDVMGDLVFGRSFDMLATGEKHHILKLLEGGQKPLGIFGGLPWIFPIVTKIPGAMNNFHRWISFCEQRLNERKQASLPSHKGVRLMYRGQMKVEEPDVMSWLLDAPLMGDDQAVHHAWETGDARLLIVAGSDTTAVSLVHAFYRLCEDRNHISILRDEVATFLTPESTPKHPRFDYHALQTQSSYLNGFINEVLRLHPPLPNGWYRLTPPEGVKIGDKYIPGNVTVAMPNWTLLRSPKCYVNPESFIPTRWSSQPELVLRKDAYIPFSMGPYGCPGKQLALMEMRSVIASVVTRFDLRFKGDEKSKALDVESEEYYTVGIESMMVELTERNSQR